MKKFLFFIFLIILLLSSCSKYQNGGEENNTAEHPDMILNNAEYIIYQKNGNPIILDAASLFFYTEDDYAIAKDLTFTTSKENGSDKIEGKADSAKIYIDKKIIEMEGNVEFKKMEDEMEVFSPSLYYDSEKNIIESKGKVVVKSKNGTFVGENFNGDLVKEEYTFSQVEKGELNI